MFSSRACRKSIFQSGVGALMVVSVIYVMVSLFLHQLDMTSHRLMILQAAASTHRGVGGRRLSISGGDYKENQEGDGGGTDVLPDQVFGEEKEAENVRDSQEVTLSSFEPEDYTNPKTDKFCQSFQMYFNKYSKHFVSHDGETFADFIKRLKKAQKKGKRLFSPRKNIKNDPPWRQFYHEIWQYGLYSTSTNVVKELLHSLATQPIKTFTNFEEGTQMKLLLTLKDGSKALLKPMRSSREQETLPDHFYFNDFERHNAEIAAFHLDRVLGFYRVPPTVGRLFNFESDFNDFENTTLENNFYISPAMNKCFFGKCDEYCNSNHPVCGNPDNFEASLSIWLPGEGKAMHKNEHNPWQRSYSTSFISPWEYDDGYCAIVKQNKLYTHGRRLLDIMDAHVFDFLTGNMDRHSIELFTAFSGDTSPVLFDNGRGFGKSKEDIFSILTPIRQCCQIRLSTLAKLVKLYTGEEKLSHLMKTSLKDDPLNPVLTDAHLEAFDRRLVHILTTVRDCVDQARGFKTVVIDDGHT